MRWAEMTVECAPDAVEAVSHAYIEAGCGGVMMTGDDPVKVQGSLPVTDELTGRMNALREHLDRLPEFGLSALRNGMTVRYAEDEDWANAWKQYFKPLRIGRHIVIKPSWEYYDPAPGDFILDLDPGMAFGTGGHPTTRLCLEALEDYVRPGMTVADIGTGSSILSLGAARLGARHVYATDIDLLPRKIAAENVARNGLGDVIDVLEIDTFESRAKECDLIVANIVANTIVELAPSLPQRLKPGGFFVASGIVDNHHDLVSGALRAVGLAPVETRREDIWICLVTRLEPEASTDSETLARAARELPPIGSESDAWAS
jgi:ribosomal protein L11 methyltransferase